MGGEYRRAVERSGRTTLHNRTLRSLRNRWENHWEWWMFIQWGVFTAILIQQKCNRVSWRMIRQKNKASWNQCNNNWGFNAMSEGSSVSTMLKAEWINEICYFLVKTAKISLIWKCQKRIWVRCVLLERYSQHLKESLSLIKVGHQIEWRLLLSISNTLEYVNIECVFIV